MKLPKLVEWKTEEEIDDTNECEFDELHHDVLIQELANNKYIICGDTHQHLCIPVFDDGYLLLSMRKWDEIMEEAFIEFRAQIGVFIEPPKGYFYMATSCPLEENLPKENQ